MLSRRNSKSPHLPGLRGASGNSKNTGLVEETNALTSQDNQNLPRRAMAGRGSSDALDRQRSRSSGYGAEDRDIL